MSMAVPPQEAALRRRAGQAAAGGRPHTEGVSHAAPIPPSDRTKALGAPSHAHGHFHHHHHHHGHGHDHGGSAEEAEQLLAALQGKGDRGSNITLLGLLANVILCVTKSVAGVWLNSASLLADAAHSLSDMASDVVTLVCWRLSRRPASESHPLGYGKYETMGGLGVSVVLVLGALGIGAHAYSLLLESLEPSLRTAPAAVRALSSFTGRLANVGKHLHDHAAADGGAATGAATSAAAESSTQPAAPLDPNAMWFALASVAVKEWLYRATLRVARDENSSVLEANAYHHRSDSLSSAVTFVAILGSWCGLGVLDPLGGLVVAGLIGRQGFELLWSALAELSDRGVTSEVRRRLEEAVEAVRQDEDDAAAAATATSSVTGRPSPPPPSPPPGGATSERSAAPTSATLLGFRHLRAVKSGVSTFVDVTLLLPHDARLSEARRVGERVRRSVTHAVKGVKEVRVQFDTPEGTESHVVGGGGGGAAD